MVQDFKAFRSDIELLIDETLSLDAQKEVFVAVAGERLEAFEAAWEQALGERPEIIRFVDGKQGAPLSQVRWPGGVIAARTDPAGVAVNRALQLINRWINVRTGKLKRSLAVYHAGKRSKAAPDIIPGKRVFITHLAAHSRKAEDKGFNVRGAPGGTNGLYRLVVRELKKEFAGSAVAIKRAFENVSDSELVKRPSTAGQRKKVGGKLVSFAREPDRLPGVFIE